MANIFRRIKDVISSNVNSGLDRIEDPEKMADQYLRDAGENLGVVKKQAADVIANEMGLQRKIKNCQDKIDRMNDYANSRMRCL